MKQLAKWIKNSKTGTWELKVHGRRYSAATVYPNGVWFTWDENGTGGENSMKGDIQEAMVEAGGCAIRQGFI